jgi:DNA polymerase-4
VFAKLASDMKKPNAVTVISKENFRDVAWPLPAEVMLGVGSATGARLRTIGVSTIGDLAVFPEAPLHRLLGSVGRDLRRFALGLDFSAVEPKEDESPDQSLGHGITTAEDLTTSSDVETLILSLTEEIGHRLFLYRRHAEGISVSVRDSRLHVKEWQCRLSSPTQSARTLAREAYELFRRNYGWENPLRSVTVRAIGLSSSELSGQIGIFDGERYAKGETLDRTVDEIRHRFGLGAIRAASLFKGAGKKKLPSRRERCALPAGARF